MGGLFTTLVQIYGKVISSPEELEFLRFFIRRLNVDEDPFVFYVAVRTVTEIMQFIPPGPLKGEIKGRFYDGLINPNLSASVRSTIVRAGIRLLIDDNTLRSIHKVIQDIQNI